MKRFVKTAMLLLIILSCVYVNAGAVDVAESQYDALELDKVEESLPEDAAGLLDGISLMDSLDLDKGISTVFSNAGEKAGGVIKGGLQSAVTLMVIILLCSVVNGAYQEGSSPVPNYVSLAGILAVSAVAVTSVKSFVGLGGSILTDLEYFSKALLPALTAAAAASGAVTSAAAKYAATALFLDVLLSVSTSIIIPIIYAYVAACIANAAVGGEGLASAANLLKWIAGSLITVVMILFVAYITLSGVISGSTDAVTTRVARTTVATVVPVVGGILADVAGTIVAGASVLRNTIGVFGVLGVCGICLIPFLRLGVQYLMYKLVRGFAALLSDNKLSKLIGCIGSAFGMILGLIGAAGVMLFVSIFSIIRTVAA